VALLRKMHRDCVRDRYRPGDFRRFFVGLTPGIPAFLRLPPPLPRRAFSISVRVSISGGY